MQGLHDFVLLGASTPLATTGCLAGKLIHSIQEESDDLGLTAPPETVRWPVARGPQHSPDRGQLRHSHARDSVEVGCRPQAHCYAVHTELVVLIESGRAIVLRLAANILRTGSFVSVTDLTGRPSVNQALQGESAPERMEGERGGDILGIHHAREAIETVGSYFYVFAIRSASGDRSVARFRSLGAGADA